MQISVFLNKESSLMLLICVRIYYIRFDINVARSKRYMLSHTVKLTSKI